MLKVHYNIFSLALSIPNFNEICKISCRTDLAVMLCRTSQWVSSSGGRGGAARLVLVRGSPWKRGVVT